MSLEKFNAAEPETAAAIVDGEGNLVVAIENKAGSQGSLAVYNHLAQTYGAITPEAAKKGLVGIAELQKLAGGRQMEKRFDQRV